MEYYKNLSLEDLFYIDDDGLVCCEKWLCIPYYTGFYQASDLGRVKSLKLGQEKILKQSLTNRYYKVALSLNGKAKTRNIHQLVAECFLGHIPCGHKLVVDHIDTNRLNNRLDNLQIVSNRINCNQKHLKSSSSYTGVSWDKTEKIWIARIWINGQNKYLGSFNNELEASKYYENALFCHKNNLPIKTNLKQKSSKYKGVSYIKRERKWSSTIQINHKQIRLGYFNNEVDAHNAYQEALKTKLAS